MGQYNWDLEIQNTLEMEYWKGSAEDGLPDTTVYAETIDLSKIFLVLWPLRQMEILNNKESYCKLETPGFNSEHKQG